MLKIADYNGIMVPQFGQRNLPSWVRAAMGTPPYHRLPQLGHRTPPRRTAHTHAPAKTRTTPPRARAAITAFRADGPVPAPIPADVYKRQPERHAALHDGWMSGRQFLKTSKFPVIHS